MWFYLVTLVSLQIFCADLQHLQPRMCPACSRTKVSNCYNTLANSLIYSCTHTHLLFPILLPQSSLPHSLVTNTLKVHDLCWFCHLSLLVTMVSFSALSHGWLVVCRKRQWRWSTQHCTLKQFDLHSTTCCCDETGVFAVTTDMYNDNVSSHRRGHRFLSPIDRQQTLVFRHKLVQQADEHCSHCTYLHQPPPASPPALAYTSRHLPPPPQTSCHLSSFYRPSP